MWLVVYYIAGHLIPFMSDLGGWNVLIGMGCMAAAFAIAGLSGWLTFRSKAATGTLRALS